MVVANGHNWAPKQPDYEGLANYTGQLIHASAYKDPAQLRGRKVLVVGGGNTGCDIAVEAAQQADAAGTRPAAATGTRRSICSDGRPTRSTTCSGGGCRCGCASGLGSGR